jgi:hypothetical protein
MKNKFLFILSSLMIIGLTACNLSIDTSTPNKGTLSVEGTGIVKITPDIAYINIGVQSKSENVKDALNENNQLASAISTTLQDLDIAMEDIQTSSFNVYPMQDYGPMGMGDENGLPTTYYQVDNIILVTVRDLSNIGQILDNAVQAGANSINSISFDVQNKEEAINQARKDAIVDAHSQAEATALDAGAQLGDVLSINTTSYSDTAPYYDGKGGVAANAMASQVPVSAGQLSISVTASMMYELK